MAIQSPQARSFRALESKQARKRRELYDLQDAIDEQRNQLIGKLEGQLRQTVAVDNLFHVAWRLP